MTMKQEPAHQIVARRLYLRAELQQVYQQTLDERVDRYIEINHQGIIGKHYFAAASSECIMLYRDGHFISAVMVSQAVNEGILKFVAERNLESREEHNTMVDNFKVKGIISKECAVASTRIWRSFRNDVHHMNPNIAEVPFVELAKQNLQDLALIEKEIFGVEFDNGRRNSACFSPARNMNTKRWREGKQ
jgi:hypothetical protein